VLEVFFLAPGDKAARCPYCQFVVELSDREQPQSDDPCELPDGTWVRPSVEVDRQGAAADPSSDLSGHVSRMLEQVQEPRLSSDAKAEVHRSSDTVEQVAETTSEGGMDDMPPEVQRMLADMGIRLDGAEAPSQDSRECESSRNLGVDGEPEVD